MAIDALYKDRDSRVQSLETEVRRQSEAHVEELVMRKMLEQQYASLKKKARSQVLGSFSYMGVLRSDILSASLGSVARPPPSTKRGRQEKGGSGAPPRDDDRDGAEMRRQASYAPQGSARDIRPQDPHLRE